MNSSDENSTDDSDCGNGSYCDVDNDKDDTQNISKNDAVLNFLAIFSFSLFIGLFLLQANIAWRSYQSLNYLSGRRSPEDVLEMYYDYNVWGRDMNGVDLKVNTSIFVH
ncbi:hypothetical protein SNE40_021603 [Patella caerulea]|uniref:Uncharacterized protein n=1 Tax=Patella caerulea TaxID=87958 RepID=A0AAN8G860_PATCE